MSGVGTVWPWTKPVCRKLSCAALFWKATEYRLLGRLYTLFQLFVSDV